MNSSAAKLINSLKRGDLKSCGLLISIYISFAILERLVLRSSSLSEADYHSPIIFLQWGSHIYAWIIIGLTTALATAARIHSIPLNWSAFTEFKGIRVIISLITCLLAWKFSTYDINLYFNQWNICH